jgi:ABC-type lipoprotein export system ATPase subunit
LKTGRTAVASPFFLAELFFSFDSTALQSRFILFPQSGSCFETAAAFRFPFRRERQVVKSRELLKRVGILPDRQQHKPAKLSGGQQQRVAIARALANDPAVILADEPTANLDSRTGAKIIELLRELVAEDRTVVVATHDDSIAERATIVVEISDGKIVSAPERTRRRMAARRR